MAEFEVKQISRMLDKIVVKQSQQKPVNGLVVVSPIDAGTDLVFGIFTYQRRAVGVEGRLLTPDITTQPSLGVRTGEGIRPTPYAEDVINHPLRTKLEGILTAHVLE